MLRIYYGRENLDKEKFMYLNMERPSIVLVPDQYTLEAEKQAMKHLGVDSLMGVEIMSFSRLGDRVLEKLGGDRATFINKYGRHILLSKIIREEASNLKVFGKVKEKSNFINAVNDFISQSKQYGLSAADLEKLAGDVESEKLSEKLQDLALIAGKYEEKIKDRFIDSEDKVELYLDKIKDFQQVKESQVWLYGFDSFAPKTLQVIEKLMECAPQVNLVMTWDEDKADKEIFRITGHLMDVIEEMAGSLGQETVREAIGQEYLKTYGNEAIGHIEENLYAIPYRKYRGQDKVTLIRSANPYNEAETAASYVLDLVREKGLRFRDIMVVANDGESGSEIIGRVFGEYGINLFVDRKRCIITSGTVMSIIALLWAVSSGYKSETIFDFLKSDFCSLWQDQVEDLENYAYKYKIRGTMWKRPFKYGDMEYGEAGLARLNDLREKAMKPFLALEEIADKAETIGDFAMEFFDMLQKEMKFPEKIDELIQFQEEKLGALGQDVAQETKQIWSCVIYILEQIVALLGDEEFSLYEFINLFKAGVESYEIGVLPMSADEVMLGTTQRSRKGDVKAVIVLGANEGLLPSDPGEGAIFTAGEMETVSQMGRSIGKLDQVRIEEEKLAIYRTFAKATDYLMVSTRTADAGGETMRVSPIFSKLSSLLPEVEVQPDILNREGQDAQLNLLGGRINTLRHLTNSLQDGAMTGEVTGVWKETLKLFNGSREAEIIEKGIGFTNEQSRINIQKNEKISGMKDDVLRISPSSLETYARCPFKHLINYRIRADERRVMEMDHRNIGNIYHDTFMGVLEELKEDGKKITDPSSRFMQISRQELDQLTEKYAKAEVAGFDQGQFAIGKREEYMTSRIIDICKENVWTLMRQARSGEIEDILMEESFGEGDTLPPVEVGLEGGKMVQIHGRIDRVDLLPDGLVKIIDYKSGNEVFTKQEAEKGYRLQLMLYLKAAQGEDKIPAGVFYYLIKEPMLNVKADAKADAEKIADEVFKSYKMNGLFVDENRVIRSLDNDFECKSSVINCNFGKEGQLSSGEYVSREEFTKLQEAVDLKVRQFCQDLVNGEIPLRPMKVKNKSACTYCLYRGICRFDTTFEGCRYEIIDTNKDSDNEKRD